MQVEGLFREGWWDSDTRLSSRKKVILGKEGYMFRSYDIAIAN